MVRRLNGARRVEVGSQEESSTEEHHIFSESRRYLFWFDLFLAVVSRYMFLRRVKSHAEFRSCSPPFNFTTNGCVNVVLASVQIIEKCRIDVTKVRTGTCEGAVVLI